MITVKKPEGKTTTICGAKNLHSMKKKPSVSVGTETRNGFLKRAMTPKLSWKTDNPVWVSQWSLDKEKLSALKKLVWEQLQKGHIKKTNSPWNSPVFVIHKKPSDSWKLLQYLRKINEVIEDRGPLQLALPSLSVILRLASCHHKFKRLFFQYSTSSKKCSTVCFFNSKHQQTRTSAKTPLGCFASKNKEFTYSLPMVCGLSSGSSSAEASINNIFTLYKLFTYFSFDSKGNKKNLWQCCHSSPKCRTWNLHWKNTRNLTVKVLRVENDTTIHQASKIQLWTKVNTLQDLQ